MSKLILIRGLRLSYHSFGFQNIKWILNQAKYSAEWRKLQALVLHQNVKGSQKNNHCFQFVRENINSRQVKSLLRSLEGETVPLGGKHLYVQWHFRIRDRCKNGQRQQKESPVAEPCIWHTPALHTHRLSHNNKLHPWGGCFQHLLQKNANTGSLLNYVCTRQKQKASIYGVWVFLNAIIR